MSDTRKTPGAVSDTRKTPSGVSDTCKTPDIVSDTRKTPGIVSDTRKARGDIGEDITARYLTERGFTILERQWRCRYGELDLIARDASGVVCFVEVKLRKRDSLAPGREAVDVRKRERLRKTASCWLSGHDPDALTRFDVAEVRADPDGFFKLDYLPDAFQ